LAFDLTYQRALGSGGSAVRFIKRALDAGAAVYRITAANLPALYSLPLSSDVMADIANAVAAGKEAVVSDATVSTGNWSGTGYIITDPATGAAAYLIDGGFNGGTDDAGCDGEPATQPAEQPVEKPNLGFFALFALAVVAIIAAVYVIGAAVALALAGGLLMMATAAAAAPPPGTPIPPGVQQVWQNTFGRVFGNLPTGPNYPGDGVARPGDCSQEQLDTLQQEKDNLCGKPSACKGNDCDVNVIQQKIDNRNACIEKRLEIMMTCFRGGDGPHWNQVVQQLNGLVTCQSCLAKAATNQCSK